MALMSVGVVLGAEPERLAVDEAEAWLAKTAGAQLLDVRTAEEYAEGHLQGARRVTWGQSDFEKQVLAVLDPSKPVLVYCRSGRRSTAAIEVMEKLGFREVRELKGGILAWQKAGRSLIKGE